MGGIARVINLRRWEKMGCVHYGAGVTFDGSMDSLSRVTSEKTARGQVGGWVK